MRFQQRRELLGASHEASLDIGLDPAYFSWKGGLSMPTLQQWGARSRPPETSQSSHPRRCWPRSRRSRRNIIHGCRQTVILRHRRVRWRVAQFAPSLTVKLAPIHLLHRLGVLTTPVVPNLTDISSTWAYIRYLWAFELPDGTPNDPLRLSDAALGLDFHQKGLMSDQIGVGMAALIMELYFNAPDGTDVSVAVNEHVLPAALAEAASPDYLFWNAERTAYCVVECKGTRCARNVSVQ